jgi:hypothetical protein
MEQWLVRLCKKGMDAAISFGDNTNNANALISVGDNTNTCIIPTLANKIITRIIKFLNVAKYP